MNAMNFEKMETIEGGFPWNSFLSGVACGYGLATAVTGVGVVIAGAFCAAAFTLDN